MHNTTFTKDNLNNLVNLFNDGESVTTNHRHSGGMTVGADVIRRDGDRLVKFSTVGAFAYPAKEWTPTAMEANRIVKLLKKNRQRQLSGKV